MVHLKHLSRCMGRFLLALSLVISAALTPMPGDQSHNLFELAEIAQEHLEEVAEHGHSHESLADLIHHAFHGHVHNQADHDHNGSFLLPEPSDALAAVKDLHDFRGIETARSGLLKDLDKPPRS